MADEMAQLKRVQNIRVVTKMRNRKATTSSEKTTQKATGKDMQSEYPIWLL